MKEADKAQALATHMRHNMVKIKGSDVHETIEAYNKLNLWMLW